MHSIFSSRQMHLRRWHSAWLVVAVFNGLPFTAQAQPDDETRAQYSSRKDQEIQQAKKDKAAAQREKAAAEQREREAKDKAAQAQKEAAEAKDKVARLEAELAAAKAVPAAVKASVPMAAKANPSGPSFRRMEPLLQVVGCSACGEMAVVPGGAFDMGSPGDEKERYGGEGPVRKGVQVAGFEIGRTEVTQGQWKAVMGSNPSRFNGCGDTCPVENVSWNDIAGPGGFLEKLKEKTGQQYRLPTEAEWEYAARAGSKGPYWWGGTIHPGQANYDGNYAYAGGGSKGEYRQTTVKADAFEANAWGLYNVHGNVWEWAQDGWHDNYQGAPMDGRDWVYGADKAVRVVRGGAWFDYPRVLRSAIRSGNSPVDRSSGTGFRLARTF